MRLFVAVNPSERFRRELATRVDAWRQRLRLAWTRPGAWHLTLMFLGEWPAERVPELQAALTAEAGRHEPFALRYGGVGAFPDLRRPRVLFLQVDGGAALDRLAAGVRERVDLVWPEGPQDHKAFRAHLTLARIKGALRGDEHDLLAQLDLGRWEPETVSEFRLVSSELDRGGARHADLAVFDLGAGE